MIGKGLPGAGYRRPRLLAFQTILLLALVMAVGLAAACSNQKGTPTQAGATPAGTPQPTTPVGSVLSPFEKLLQLIPTDENTRQLAFVTDYAQVRKVFGIALPGPDADQSKLEEYLSAMLLKDTGIAEGPFISGFDNYFKLTLNRRQYLGFDVRDVEQSIMAGNPPGVLEGVLGHFDAGATEKALASCADCPPASREEHQGVQFYSWGEDLALDPTLRLKPPAFDALGRGGRIAVQDQYVLRALSTDGINALIEASKKQRPSLADQEEFRAMAKGLTTLGTYTALLTDRVDDQKAKPVATSEPLLRPYLTFATGMGKDDQGPYMALVIVHRDADAAAQNVDLLRQRIDGASSLTSKQPWKTLFTSVEAHADGSVLTAKLRGASVRGALWLSWVLNRDPLLLHE